MEFDYSWMEDASVEEIQAELEEVRNAREEYIAEGWVGVDKYIDAMETALQKRG